MIRLAVATVLVTVSSLGAQIPALAEGASLTWGSEVNPSRCPTDQGYRYLEINVTRQVEADPTRGVLGNTWAILDYNQHIQVWKIGTVGEAAERFCALVRYQGSFTTLAGASPRGTDPSIASGIEGSFEGGYRLVFSAEELASPAYRERGHIGTFAGPIGLTDWRNFYYTSIDSDSLEWWGWIYHGGNNGAWTTSILGEQGDITD